MYLADPVSGVRRRALLRNKAASSLRAAAVMGGKAARDARGRLQGMAAEARAAIRRTQAMDDVLVSRVRSRLGRHVRHPDAVEVAARDGIVTLSGVILADEADDLRRAVRKTPGVRRVEERLRIRERAGDESALQGAGSLRRPRTELLQESWAPGVRLLVGAAGAAALGASGTRIGGAPLALAGAGLLLRAASNRPLMDALGLRESRRGIHIRKTVHVRAPVEDVYRLWSRPEDFPRFMSHVREVKKLGEKDYLFTIDAAGLPVSWGAVVTDEVANRLISWKSVDGTTVRNVGTVRFEPEEGGTRIDIQISYNPVGGVVSHALASLAGRDPKHLIDDDMVRFKSLVEQGHTRAHGQEVKLSDVP